MSDLRVLSARPVSTEHNAKRQPKNEFVVAAEVMRVDDERSRLLVLDGGKLDLVTVATGSIRCPGMIPDPTVTTGFCDYIAEYSERVDTLALRGLRHALDIEVQRLADFLWRMRYKVRCLAFEHRTLSDYRSVGPDGVFDWLRLCVRTSTGNAMSIERMVDIVRKEGPRDLAGVLRCIGPDADIDFAWLSESKPQDVTEVTLHLLDAIVDGHHPNAVQARRGALQASFFGMDNPGVPFLPSERDAIVRDEPDDAALDFLRGMGWVHESSDGPHVAPVGRAWALGELGPQWALGELRELASRENHDG